RQPGLDRVEAVVAVDQVVDVAEVPPLGDAAPVGGPLGVRRREPALVLADQLLDLPQALHVRQRAAERRDVGVGLGAEVAEPAPQSRTDERVDVAVGREPLALPLRRRRHVADAPFAEDLLCARSLHPSKVATRILKTGVRRASRFADTVAAVAAWVRARLPR